MKLLVDMNLSPRWVGFLAGHGMEALHWSAVGAADAPDADLMQYARAQSRIVLTHDLDFGALLAHTGEAGPSVLLLRTAVPHPELMGMSVVRCVQEFSVALRAGALIVLDEKRSKLRLLPLQPPTA